jgi:hypothetical protein
VSSDGVLELVPHGTSPSNLEGEKGAVEVKVAKYILQMFTVTILIGCLASGALAKGGGGGSGEDRGGHVGGGGGALSGTMHSDGGRQFAPQAAPSLRLAEPPSYGPPSGQSSPQTSDRFSAPAPQSPRGTERQSYFRGPENGPQNAERGQRPDHQQLNALVNGREGGHAGHEDDFRKRFTDSDQFDRNGENFRRNADSIRRDFGDRDRDDLPFRLGWWDNRGFDRWVGPWECTWWRDRPWYWWCWTTAPGLDAWLTYGWDRPCYWDYGPNGYIYYQENQFYENGQPYLAADAYYQQVYDLAHCAPANNPDDAAKIAWMPLGVFAVTSEGKQEEDRLIQLNVSRQGVLSGVCVNKATDDAYPLQGMVDPKTHRCAWYFADGSNDRMIFETSIDNLTEPQSTVMLHFGPGDVSVWQLVRIERPEARQLSEPQGQAESTPRQTPPQPPQHELP